MPPRKRLAEPDTVALYRRVSTEDQVDSGLGLESQNHKLHEEAARRGWRIVGEYVDEGISAKTVEDRPDLVACLEFLDGGGAANLMATKLDRLSRSVHDFTGMVERSAKKGWNLVVLDIGVDTSTAAGEMMANVLATFAQFERKLIGERTSAALQAKKRDGAILGSPMRSDPYAARLIVNLHQRGHSLQWIADWLMMAGIAPGRGGLEWRPSSVRAVLVREGVVPPLASAVKR